MSCVAGVEYRDSAKLGSLVRGYTTVCFLQSNYKQLVST